MNAYHIGRQQLTLILRSKWLLGFGLLFMFLAFFVTYFSQTENTGFDGFNRMTASLLNLNLLMIPLISLLMGSMFLAGEKEDSGLQLLLTYPIYVRSVLIGKYAGLFVALSVVLTGGYGIALLSMYLINSHVSLIVILKFYLLSLLLSGMFVALSILIGILSKTRIQALGLSLVVWAIFTLFYEFMLMGISLFLPKQSILLMLSVAIFLNPAELIRVWSILSLDGASVFGPGLYDLTVWASGGLGTLLFIASSCLWIAVPLIITGHSIKRGIKNDG